MSDLPESWVRAPLGNLIASIVGGGTPSKAIQENFRGTIPFMTVKDMHSRFIEDTQDHINEKALSESASTVVPADTLIVSSRMSLGKIARPKVPVAINQDLKALFLHEGIDKTYVEYAWRANESTIKARGTGTTVKGIRLEDIRGLEVAVAPSREQTRIADQLDTLLARIQACNDRLDAIPALLKRFRQAVLSAATSSELIDDELSAIPVVALRAVLAEPMRNGKSVRDGNGLPVLRLTSLKQSAIDLGATKTGDWTEVANVQRFLIQNGDYLVSRGNGSKELVGRGGLVAGCEGDIAFPDTMIRIRPDKSRLLTDYLGLVWAAPIVRRQIESAAKTTAGIWKVSQPDLESVEFPLPSIETQAEIVRRVHMLSELADRIEARYVEALTHAQRLAPLTLAKAFRGELVPQDSDDEPASILLTRIGAQQRALASFSPVRTLRRSSPPRAPKETAAMTKSRQDNDVMNRPYLAGHLRRIGTPTNAEALFKLSELPVADFYKQLAWEVARGHVKDNQTTLEPGNAAG
jgi:type I restriction enzyme S subunit